MNTAYTTANALADAVRAAPESRTASVLVGGPVADGISALPLAWTRAVVARVAALATASSRPAPIPLGTWAIVRDTDDVAGRVTAIRGRGRHAVYTVAGTNGCTYERPRAGLRT